MKSIFVTGSTGVLGSAVVPLFLADRDTRVILLIRAKSQEQLDERVLALWDYWRLPAESHSWQERLEAVAGDVTEVGLGMTPDKIRQLAKQVTHIVHAAGNVKLNQTIDDARKTAVNAARSIIDLAEQCRANGQFQKLEFVSTVGVAGRRSGIVPEQPFRQDRTLADFHNTYEAAKWEAERLLWAEIDQGLPATVHRPSMIVGDSKSGRIIRFQVFYFLVDFLIGRRSWGFIPRTDSTQLDIVPVDYVAEAIYRSAVQGLATGKVLHLSSGPKQSWQVDSLIDALRGLATRRGEKLPRLKRLSAGTFRRLLQILQRLAPGRSRRSLQGLPYFLDYLDEKQVFDNVQTKAILSATGLRLPSVEEYLEPVMQAYWDDRKS